MPYTVSAVTLKNLRVASRSFRLKRRIKIAKNHYSFEFSGAEFSGENVFEYQSPLNLYWAFSFMFLFEQLKHFFWHHYLVYQSVSISLAI